MYNSESERITSEIDLAVFSAFMGDRTLENLGEFRILNEIVKPTLNRISPENVGDDCAIMRFSEDADLVVTIDATPTPAVSCLGPCSYATWGWYAGLISTSDLAAAGAEPFALCTSVEAAASMSAEDLRAFFEGLSEFCQIYSIKSAGGNIREARTFACHVTALGVVPTGKGLRRTGCMPGDTIVAIGPCGEFASALVRAKKLGLDALDADSKRALLHPRPQLREMLLLRQRGLVAAASDNSDGLLGALFNIAEASQCAIDLLLEEGMISNSVCEAAAQGGLDPWNLIFFWGDWQVVAAIPQRHEALLRNVARESNIQMTRLGQAVQGSPGISCTYKNKRFQLPVLRNEAFTRSSFGNTPLEHMDTMLRFSLFGNVIPDPPGSDATY